MTLYPVFSKYGVGDKINGKTVVYVRNGSKVKISLGLFSSPLEFDVTGNWMYLAVDDNAGSASTKSKWAASSISVSTSDDVGAGKSNTDAILAAFPSATTTDNAAKASAQGQALCPRAANCILSIKRSKRAKSTACRRIRRRKMRLDSSTLIFGRLRRRTQQKRIP